MSKHVKRQINNLTPIPRMNLDKKLVMLTFFGCSTEAIVALMLRYMEKSWSFLVVDRFSAKASLEPCTNMISVSTCCNFT
jgi:hypothetical protein